MKEIGKHNYLDLFLEFHEGLLSQDEQSLVHAFLLSNPQYQIEFDTLADCYLPLENELSFKSKAKLKKSISEPSEQDIDLLMARFVEDDLSETELLDFNRRVEIDPDFESALNFYKAAKLDCSSVEFPQRNSLKIKDGESMPPFLLSKLEALNAELKVTPDKAIEFPRLNELKREETKVIPLFTIWRAISVVAASALIVWMLWPVHNPQGRVSNFLSSSENLIKKATDLQSAEIFEIPLAESESSLPVQENPEGLVAEDGSPEPGGERTKIQVEKISSLFASEISNTSNQSLALPMKPSKLDLKLNSRELQASGNQSQHFENPYISLSEYARTRLNKSLVKEENPEEGLILAFLDKTVDRIAENSEVNIDLELKKEKGKKLNHFRFTIGRLEIVK